MKIDPEDLHALDIGVKKEDLNPVQDIITGTAPTLTKEELSEMRGYRPGICLEIGETQETILETETTKETSPGIENIPGKTLEAEDHLEVHPDTTGDTETAWMITR